MLTDLARQRQKLQRPFEPEILARHVLGDRCALGVLAVAQLDIGAEATRPLAHRLAGHRIGAELLGSTIALIRLAAALGKAARIFAFGIVGASNERTEPAAAQRQTPLAAFRAQARITTIGLFGEEIRLEELVELGGDLGRLLLHHLGGLGLEIAPEGLEHRAPFRATARHVVQLFLEAGGEVVSHIALEESLEKACQQPARFLCEETILLDAHIGAVLEHLDDRGIGRGPPDSQLLEPLDQRCFGKARRRLGEMLHGVDRFLRWTVAPGHDRQQAAILAVGIVEPFLVQREEAREFHHLTIGAQRGAPRAVDQFDDRALEQCGRHLAGERALEDQVVEPRMVARTGAIAAEIGGADRLMRFLRVLGLGLVLARGFGEVMTRIALGNRLARFLDRAAIHLNAIGSHIGDRAVLVEALRNPHGVAGGEAQLARGFLLQRRGGERRRRIALHGPSFDRLDGEMPGFDLGLGGFGGTRIAERELVELLALQPHQPRGEGLAVLLHLRADRPVFLRGERLDLALALDD